MNAQNHFLAHAGIAGNPERAGETQKYCSQAPEFVQLSFSGRMTGHPARTKSA